MKKQKPKRRYNSKSAYEAGTLQSEPYGTLTIRAPRDLVERAKSRAKSNDVTLSQVVRRALLVYVEGGE